jgi:hypothetical protein
MELSTRELSTAEWDLVTEVQLNIDLENETELNEAINELAPEALIALREAAQNLIARQHHIIARVQDRLAPNN